CFLVLLFAFWSFDTQDHETGLLRRPNERQHQTSSLRQILVCREHSPQDSPCAASTRRGSVSRRPRNGCEECAMEEELEALFKEEYQQILQLARSRLARERAPISTTTLAHELYLDLQHR